MFDIGWTEIFFIGVVTLLVVGPKEIPYVLRNVMAWVKKARALASDFQSGVDDMVREAELDKLKDQVTKTAEGDLDFARDMEDALDPTGTAEGALDFEMPDIEDDFSGDKPEIANSISGGEEMDMGIDAHVSEETVETAADEPGDAAVKDNS